MGRHLLLFYKELYCLMRTHGGGGGGGGLKCHFFTGRPLSMAPKNDICIARGTVELNFVSIPIESENFHICFRESDNFLFCFRESEN